MPSSNLNSACSPCPQLVFRVCPPISANLLKIFPPRHGQRLIPRHGLSSRDSRSCQVDNIINITPPSMVAHTSEILALGRWKQEYQCAAVSSGNKTSQFGGKLLKIENVKADVKQQGYVLFVFCCCFWFFETSYLYVVLAGWKLVIQTRLASNQRSACLCISSAEIKGL